MFTNTFSVLNGSGNEKFKTSLHDGPRDGRTVRRSADGLTELTIAHQSTNEQPGFLFQRSNVRLSVTKVNEETSEQVRAYVQLTLGIPKTEFTAEEINVIVANLVRFLVNGESGDSTPTINDDENSFESVINDVVDRLVAGEP
jgi:hypothetical protein